VNTVSTHQYMARECQTAATLVTAGDFGRFDASACYIVEWTYRLSTVGVRTLTGERSTKGREDGTGHERKCYFYWLGAHSTAKDQVRRCTHRGWCHQ